MRKKFCLTKKIISFLLCFIMLFGFIPMPAYALPGDGGNIVTELYTDTDVLPNSLVKIHATDAQACEIKRGSGNGYQQLYNLTWDSEKWDFVGWTTWYKGEEDRIGTNKKVDASNPVFDDENSDGSKDYYFFDPKLGANYPFNPKSTVIGVNYESGYYGNYYIYAIFKPIVSVNVGDGVTYSFSGGRYIDNNKYGVTYSNNATISYNIIDSKYIVSGTSANYGTNYSDQNGIITLSEIVRPATVSINTRLKQQKVSFDANNGSGSMNTQTFSYGEEKALSTNSFTREKYTFIGWNTKADGSGTSYIDKQSITFNPENDGDSITLYAQWEQFPSATYITAPTANNLIYNGSSQELVSEGITNEGTMMYSLEENGNYTDIIPTAINADNYTVWYYIKGDSDHSDSPKESVKVEISKADPEIGTVSAEIVNDTTDISAIVLERTNDTVEGKLIVEAGQTLELGDNEITYIFTPNDTQNYNSIKGKVNVTVKDTIAPNGTVTITDAKTLWDKILETITFDLYFNTDQKVVVQAIDSFSGVEKIEYYETADILDLDEINTLSNDMWKAMNDGSVVVTVEDAKQFIYYIRITDKSGNVGYIATNGAEFDTTAPIIDGVNNGDTYYTSQKISVTDKNLDVVTLNGETVAYTIILKGDKEDTYTIVATDKVGNSSTVTIKMAKLDDITNINSNNVTPEDKTELEDVKTDLEKSLEKNADIYSEDEKKTIEEKIKNIDEALEVIKNVEDVETIINNLPDKIKKDDIEDVETAKKAYDKLSDYEKTLIDQDLEKKLNAAIKAAEEANKPISNPQTGDNIFIYVGLLLISIVGIATIKKFRKNLKQ